jgi:hypothetical protein
MKKLILRCFCIGIIGLLISCGINSLSASISVTDRSNLGWHDYYVAANYSGGSGQPYFTWKVNNSQLNLQYNTSGFSLVLPFDGIWKIDLDIEVEGDSASASYNLTVPNPGTLDYIKGKNMLGKWLTNISIGGIPLEYNFTHMWKSTSSNNWNVIHQKVRGMAGTDGIGGYRPTSKYDYSFSDFGFSDDTDLFVTFDIEDNDMTGVYYSIQNDVWSDENYFSASLLQEASNAPLNPRLLSGNSNNIEQSRYSEILDYSEILIKHINLIEAFDNVSRND